MIVVEFLLRALSGGGLPWFVGHECRAGFISLVSRLDPELGSLLHEGLGVSVGKRKAVFSLRPLRFVSGFKVVFPERPSRFLIDGNVVFSPEAQATLGVTFFNDDLAGKLLMKLLSEIQTLKISIKGYEFHVERLSFEVVNPRELINSKDESEWVDIEFVTPTYFNPLHGDSKYKVLYPDPTLMLASLISTSHQLTSVDYPKPEELASMIYVSGLDIKTPLIREMQKEAPTGFVGWVKLRFKDEASSETRRKIIGLLKLGELTNVGGNRSGGYGVIKLKLKQEEQTQPIETEKPN